MKIAVCIKQVPASSEGEMNKETGVLMRSNLPAVFNVYDCSALEAALRIKEQQGAQITVFTMGPVSAEGIVRTAFALGADEGCLVCDTAFAGADVLATSYTLMQAIKQNGTFDLILCGKQTTDGDTAQVSGALAKWFEIPHMNWVTEIQETERNWIKVKYLMEKRHVTAQFSLPCLLSVEKEAFPCRMPSLALKIAAKKKEIKRYTLENLQDQDENHYGLKGSATRVTCIFPPERTKQQDLFHQSKEEAAEHVLRLLYAKEEDER